MSEPDYGRWPSRRRFLATSSAASAGLLLPSLTWGAPSVARQVAPAQPPAEAGRAQQALSASPVPLDEAIAMAAVEAAVAAGASYADARLVLYRVESIDVRDDHIEAVSQAQNYGLAVRVIADGGWGFAASSTIDKDTAARLAKQSVSTARGHGALLKTLGRPPVAWADAPAAQGHWVAPHEIDPFAVSIQEKAQVLLAA